MSSVNVQHGLNLAWALGVTNYSITGITGIFQSSDHNFKTDKYEVRDQRGAIVAVDYYNNTEEATFEYFVSDSQTPASGNASVSASVIPNGTLFTLGADANDPISGSYWIADDTVVKRTNTEAAKVTLKATRYPNITS